jgi:anti-sigma factor RsiW
MTENICRYSGDRDHAIVSYLYSDDGGFDVAERAAFDAHLVTCDRCRAELASFEGVRATLGAWSPPHLRSEKSLSFGAAGPVAAATSHQQPATGDPPPATSHRSRWREIPAWAQVAAAMLCLGVGASVANLDVRYDASGLQVRTGWLTAARAPVAEAGEPISGVSPDAAPWRAELTALEQRLRADLRQPPANPTNVVANRGNLADSANPAYADLLRRVRTLVDDSERRQQRELALRLGEAVREVNAQRQFDLMRIDRSIGAMQNNTGREMLRQRNEILTYVSAVRTASQRPQ